MANVPFVAGQRILASDLNFATQQSAWTSYTPTWTSDGSAPAVNNGTLTGYYSKVGRLVTARIMLATGSTTTYGTGNYFFSLPLTAAVTGAATGAPAHTGAWVIFNAGNSTFYTPNAFIRNGNPNTVFGAVNASGNFLSATNPSTWSGTGTLFSCSITYESTS